MVGGHDRCSPQKYVCVWVRVYTCVLLIFQKLENCHWNSVVLLLSPCLSCFSPPLLSPEVGGIVAAQNIPHTLLFQRWWSKLTREGCQQLLGGCWVFPCLGMLSMEFPSHFDSIALHLKELIFHWELKKRLSARSFISWAKNAVNGSFHSVVNHTERKCLFMCFESSLLEETNIILHIIS